MAFDTFIVIVALFPFAAVVTGLLAVTSAGEPSSARLPDMRRRA